MKKNTLIIGAGGVGNVVAFKCAMNIESFGNITLASRTVSKCDSIATDIKKRLGIEIATASVDADSVGELVQLIRETRADIVINVALPYQDLTIMDACTQMEVTIWTLPTTSIQIVPSLSTKSSGRETSSSRTLVSWGY